MFASRALTSAIVVGAVAIGSVFAAAPANAATLPSGQQITVVDYFEWQFSEANPETAALTPVGTGSPIVNENVTAVDVNDDGIGYAFTTAYEEILPEECDFELDPDCVPDFFSTFVPEGAYLFTADANTGTLGANLPVTIVTGPADEPILADADECLALDYSDGVLLGACNIYGEDDSAWIGTIDPATAILTPSVLLFAESFIQFQAIALDPIDGALWGFEADTTAWVIDLGGSEPVSPGNTEMAVYAADFDRDGQIWVSAYRAPLPPSAEIGPNQNGLATLDLVTGNFTFDAVWSDPAARVDALTVWGKEVLAETGVTQNPAVAVGATAILLFGALMAAGAMAMRRRSAES